jgi:neutral amino acid transport system ATP-binding protein
LNKEGIVSVLQLFNISKSFDEVKAIKDVSLSIESGSVTSLIGPNGAGKTTLFNLISGFITPDAGQISFKNCRLGNLSASERANQGIGRTWQDGRLFRNMTLLDNLLVARRPQSGESILNRLFKFKAVMKQEEENVCAAHEVLRMIKLEQKKLSLASDLSYGQQKLLSLGRLLMNDDELLLLDEPTSSVDPVMVEQIIGLIGRLSEGGRTIIIIEHNVPLAMSISDHVFVLSRGRIELAGDTSYVSSDPRLKEVYWGV